MFNRLIFILSLAGLVLTLHIWIQQTHHFEHGCLGTAESAPEQGLFQCQAVMESAAGKLLGVSNAVWGALFYAALALISLFKLFSRRSLILFMRGMGFALSFAGLLYSIYLLLYQAFGIGHYCILCLTSDGLVAGIFACQALELMKKAEAHDPQKRVKEVKFFTLCFGVGLFFLGGVLWWNGFSPTRFTFPAPKDQGDSTENNTISPSQNPKEPLGSWCAFDSSRSPISDFHRLVSPGDPFLGNPQANVILVEFFDPNCPHCKEFHESVFSKLVEKYQSKVKFLMKPMALWDFSIPQVESIWLAGREGKFYDMIDLQFKNQIPDHALPWEKIKALAQELHLDMGSFLQNLSQHTLRSQVEADRRKAHEMGVITTPTVLLNGRFVSDYGMSQSCVSHLLDQELEKVGK